MNVEAVSSIVDAGVPVANSQVQFSLLDRRPLNGMIDYCMANGIKVGVGVGVGAGAGAGVGVGAGAGVLGISWSRKWCWCV
jgi:aryl-alcohol dehydrogenase-like predicted oxidoreductase